MDRNVANWTESRYERHRRVGFGRSSGAVGVAARDGGAAASAGGAAATAASAGGAAATAAHRQEAPQRISGSAGSAARGA
jgi:hypothetical protein